ncbi:related to mitochondrial translation initiation factor 2 (IF-2; GTPase) [Cephalotrichum gorgonifer]|uniref:Translation initiation factor IF-2, mitochondrial n=1 Tax=Cephalotrichum gorgonifer TaxID=2041049 RepID=A0AAE8MY26_9PEZI|nr:related to mitochondrial translation initiation factor 2 (IF-2; GTPase) [Cephalotrichum gorgonifer]
MISRRLLRTNGNPYVCSLCNNGLRSTQPATPLSPCRRWISTSSPRSAPPLKSSGWGSSSFVPKAPAKPATSGGLTEQELAARRALFGPAGATAPKKDDAQAPARGATSGGLTAEELAATRARLGPAGATRPNTTKAPPVPPSSSKAIPHQINWDGPASKPTKPTAPWAGPRTNDTGSQGARKNNPPSFAARPSGQNSPPSFAARPSGQSSAPSFAARPAGQNSAPSFSARPSGQNSAPSFASGPSEDQAWPTRREQQPPRMAPPRSDKKEDFWGNFGAPGSASTPGGGRASRKSEAELPTWSSLPRRRRQNAGGWDNQPDSGSPSFAQQTTSPSWTQSGPTTSEPSTSGFDRFSEFAKSKDTPSPRRRARAREAPEESWASRFSGPMRSASASEAPWLSSASPKARDVAKDADYAPDHTQTSTWGSRQPNSRDESRYAERSRKSRASVSRRSRGGREDDEDYDEEIEIRAEQARQRKAEEKAARKAARREEPQTHQIFLPEYISVPDLAKALRIGVDDFIKMLEEYGFEEVAEDSIFTGETAGLVAQEFGFDVKVDDGMARDIRPQPMPEDLTGVPSRPPVIAIMGHVDHGKTTLLDYIRKSSVAAQEHGGITQHIGAFAVNLPSGKSVTFLDTPGHAAFLSMRQRGAEVTDIVILVVAADDSVMPQTLEALKHARAANAPIIVAITKADKEDARIEQVKSDLSHHGVEIEEYGGDVQVVPVSGKTGLGMKDLEEAIVSLSEILDVRGGPDGPAEGWVLEASVKSVGKAATVLVKRGTLRVGDCLVCGTAWAKVRVLRNEAGQEVQEALPGTPVEVLGWRDELPNAGDRALQPPDEAKARSAVAYRREMQEREKAQKRVVEAERQRKEAEAAAEAKAAAEAASAAGEPAEAESRTATVNFIVRGDVVGSVEAVSATIQEIGNNEVRPRILRAAAGAIVESDVEYAAMSNSVIVNFNLAIPGHVKNQAEEAGVKIIDRSVIYHVVDDVKAELSAQLPDNISQRVLGEAEVQQVFPINVKGRVFKNIAGCKIRNGALKKTDMVRVHRKGKKIFDGKLESLKHGKKDVTEMKKGSECGIGCLDFQDVEVGDLIQAYEVVREKRSL